MSQRHGPRKPRISSPATTRRIETPALEGREPLPEELTGRASGTGENLSTLFEDGSGAHLSDGFRGGSDDDRETDVKKLDTPEIASVADSDDDLDGEAGEVS